MCGHVRYGWTNLRTHLIEYHKIGQDQIREYEANHRLVEYVNNKVNFMVQPITSEEEGDSKTGVVSLDEAQLAAFLNGVKSLMIDVVPLMNTITGVGINSFMNTGGKNAWCAGPMKTSTNTRREGNTTGFSINQQKLEEISPGMYDGRPVQDIISILHYYYY